MNFKHNIEEFSDHVHRIHGQLEMEMVDNILTVFTGGPFNIEFMNALFKAGQSSFEEIKVTDNVGSIVVFHDSMMMSFETFDACKNLTKHIEHPSSAIVVAYVVSQDVEGRAIMLPMFEVLFKFVGVTWRSFEDLETATVWVKTTLNSKVFDEAA